MKLIYKQIFTTDIMFLIGKSAVAQFDASMNLADLNGSNGFTINGEGLLKDFSDASVSYAGDVNDDDIDDVIIGDLYMKKSLILKTVSMIEYFKLVEFKLIFY